MQVTSAGYVTPAGPTRHSEDVSKPQRRENCSHKFSPLQKNKKPTTQQTDLKVRANTRGGGQDEHTEWKNGGAEPREEPPSSYSPSFRCRGLLSRVRSRRVVGGRLLSAP